MFAVVLAASVRIGVFGLFHPVELEVEAAPGTVLVVESNGRTQVLEGVHVARLRSAATVTGRDGAEARFILSVPGKIRREFHGRLEVRTREGLLTAIVEMDRETAVASIVAAEGPPGAPIEARKAQAIVARSFLAASHGRHDGFDFCDTTHCQFLREPPAAGTAALQAQEETRGLVVAYQGRVIATLYSANCGGRTRTLEEAGWHVDGYPFFSVDCPAPGASSGHRIGMCQVGAGEMARRGSTFREILNHYFPATTIGDLSN
jgi:peptidoglycan hydrolase-like amidase